MGIDGFVVGLREVHQTLHGYSGGHRLLAASVDLPRDAQHLMLIMSDLAGPRLGSGFDEYLTGYPVKGSNYYALARTWLAYEMPRPGCVWTHTLLVPIRDLPDTPGTILTQGHHRPNQSETALYEMPLKVNRTTQPTAIDASHGEAILHTLYEFPDQATWTASSSGAALEGLVLAVWDQQWADLRKQFAFSTGSLSPRRLDGRLMDLQVVPESQIATWLELKGAREASFRRRAVGWAKRAADELSAPGDLTDFLVAFGSGGRSNFAGLAKLYSVAERARVNGDVAKVLRDIAALDIPTSRQSRIKAYFLRREFRLDNERVLEALLESREAARLVKSVEISSRVAELVANDRQGAWRLARRALDSREDSQVRRQLLRGIADSIDGAEVIDRDDADWPVVLEIIRLRPIHAAVPELWKTSASTQRALIDTLSKSTVSDKDLRIVLQSIVQAGSDGAIRSAASIWPEAAAIALLDVAQGVGGHSHWSAAVYGLLQRQLPAVKKWITSQDRLRKPALRLLAEALDPRDLPKGTSIPDWTELLEIREEVSLSPRAYCFLLKLGLTNSSSAAMLLVAQSFGHVHHLAASDELPETAWALLEPALPHLGLLRDWDHCDRIRRAVANAWIRNAWPLERLWAAAPTGDVERRLRKSIPAGVQKRGSP